LSKVEVDFNLSYRIKKEMPKHITAPINAFNASDIDTQTTYPEFFEVIRNHKAYNLYFQFSVAMTRPPGETNPATGILKEYEKEKKKLMKELQIYKTHCKQPGAVIDDFMWKTFMSRPRTRHHNYEDCPNPEDCNHCIRPV
jgi:hypothetical protein